MTKYTFFITNFNNCEVLSLKFNTKFNYTATIFYIKKIHNRFDTPRRMPLIYVFFILKIWKHSRDYHCHKMHQKRRFTNLQYMYYTANSSQCNWPLTFRCNLDFISYELSHAITDVSKALSTLHNK